MGYSKFDFLDKRSRAGLIIRTWMHHIIEQRPHGDLIY